MDELLSVPNQRRGHAGALGVPTATMGIAAALTSGIAAPRRSPTPMVRVRRRAGR